MVLYGSPNRDLSSYAEMFKIFPCVNIFDFNRENRGSQVLAKLSLLDENKQVLILLPIARIVSLTV